jgi:hypothetical protein
MWATAVRDAELGEEIGDVVHHRAVTDEEGLADLLATLPLDQQAQKLFGAARVHSV